MKIRKYVDFLNEELNDTPESYVEIALKQIKIDTGQDISPTNIYSASLGAALLLARYKKLFSNQIPLMVAAYNAGEGTVKKFLRDTAATGKGFLPSETKIYILNVVPMVA